MYTCGDSVSPWKAAEYLEQKRQAKKTESFEVSRGMADKIRQFAEHQIDAIQVKQEVFEDVI